MQITYTEVTRSADLASAMYLGTLDMLSIPPATTISLIPNWILCAARIVAAKENIIPFSSLVYIGREALFLGKNERQDYLFLCVKDSPFIPDAQTLLMVVHTTVLGKPAPRAACLAGAWPKLAERTFPKKTSCTSAGSTFALLRASTGKHRKCFNITTGAKQKREMEHSSKREFFYYYFE